jgi:hypothetical protein
MKRIEDLAGRRTDRSWKVRPPIPAAMQARSKGWEIESGRMPHTHASVLTPGELI